MKTWTIKIKVPDDWNKSAFLGVLIGYFPKIKIIIEDKQNNR